MERDREESLSIIHQAERRLVCVCVCWVGGGFKRLKPKWATATRIKRPGNMGLFEGGAHSSNPSSVYR